MHRAWSDRQLREAERALPLSEAYFAETARIREQSGVMALKTRIAAAKQQVDAAYEAIASTPAVSMVGLRAKSLAYLQSGGVAMAKAKSALPVINDAYRLAVTVVRLTAPADGIEWQPITLALHEAVASLAKDSASDLQ